MNSSRGSSTLLPIAASPLLPATKPQLVSLEHQTRTAGAFAILSTLFAGVQAQLLSGIPDETSPRFSQSLINALHFFSYGGLAINISGSLAAIFFIAYANIVLAEQDDAGVVKASQQDVTSHELRRLRHLFLALPILGTYFILLQILLLLWTAHLSIAVFVMVIIVIWVSFWPLTLYMYLMGGRRKRA